LGSIIAEAYMKGIRGYPVDDALKAMVASATYAPYGGLGAYMKLGYVPIDKEPEAASKTLEYAFDDWTLAQMARAAGRKDVADQFTAMGFYPVAPASNEYVIGRPFLNRATIKLPNGKHFTIVAEHLDDAHPYVGKVTLNGKPLERVFIRHQDIEAGGELRFEMRDTPNKEWGRALNSRPFSMSGYGS
jgi:putative alpha-1,2-mannosidase